MNLEPEIQTKAAFRVYGLKYRGANQNNEVAALWRELMPRMGELLPVASEEATYGLMANYDAASGEFDYVAGFAVQPEAALPEGMEAWPVPGGAYLVYSFPFGEIAESYRYIYESGLPQSGRQRLEGIEFERYPGEFDPQNPVSLMQVWIPVAV